MLSDMNIKSHDLNTALDAVIADLPPENGDAGFVRGLHTVPIEFIVSAVEAIEELPRLRAAGRLDAKKAKRMIEFLAAFRPVVEKMLAVAGDLTFAMNAWKAEVAAEALQVYSLAKLLADDPAVAAHVETMRRNLGRAGRPRTRTARAAKAPRPKPFVPRPFED